MQVDLKKSFNEHTSGICMGLIHENYDLLFFYSETNQTMGSVSVLLVSNWAACEGLKTLLYQCISFVLFLDTL
jgi:hypothetical protein